MVHACGGGLLLQLLHMCICVELAWPWDKLAHLEVARGEVYVYMVLVSRPTKAQASQAAPEHHLVLLTSVWDARPRYFIHLFTYTRTYTSASFGVSYGRHKTDVRTHICASLCPHS
jgi:hypothetical protein